MQGIYGSIGGFAVGGEERSKRMKNCCYLRWIVALLRQLQYEFDEESLRTFLAQLVWPIMLLTTGKLPCGSVLESEFSGIIATTTTTATTTSYQE